MLNRPVCGICAHPKTRTRTEIGVCRLCDTDNKNPAADLYWPEDYVAAPRRKS